MEMENLEIKEKDDVPIRVQQVDPQAVPVYGAKVRNSTFLVTYNTNYKPKTNADAEAAHDLLLNASNHLFRNPDKVKQIVKFLIPGHVWSDDTIRDVDLLIGVEMGNHPKGGRIHGHTKVEINHMSKIHLDPVKIKANLNWMMNEHINVKYVNIKLIGNSRAVEEYIRK